MLCRNSLKKFEILRPNLDGPSASGPAPPRLRRLVEWGTKIDPNERCSLEWVEQEVEAIKNEVVQLAQDSLAYASDVQDAVRAWRMVSAYVCQYENAVRLGFRAGNAQGSLMHVSQLL